MRTRLITATALVAAALAAPPALASPCIDRAVWACQQVDYQAPAFVYDLAYDGGFYTVWIEDGFGRVWRCVVDDAGNVFDSEPVLTA